MFRIHSEHSLALFATATTEYDGNMVVVYCDMWMTLIPSHLFIESQRDIISMHTALDPEMLSSAFGLALRRIPAV